MGLATSHNCWSGSYSSFSEWRRKISEVSGFGDMMEYDSFSQPHENPNLMIVGTRVWPDDPIASLLSHSDCDGSIPWIDCVKMADELEKLLPALERSDRTVLASLDYGNVAKTEQFIKGLRLAHSLKEDVEFH